MAVLPSEHCVLRPQNNFSSLLRHFVENDLSCVCLMLDSKQKFLLANCHAFLYWPKCLYFDLHPLGWLVEVSSNLLPE